MFRLGVFKTLTFRSTMFSESRGWPNRTSGTVLTKRTLAERTLRAACSTRGLA
ncbi:hypothetical protein [Tiger frog virus]|uniref:Uncharacterized protein n=1 Tax=Rana tigrina ranavirus TaxID=160691 RepID=Q2WEV1_RTRV|nr:hypothetical protein [Tiger frog virus]QKG82185.1 hypothetical protein [Tiger frog virus]QKG82287.1 hypothetical protein [Tiger frog virus]QKG82390.1 hypothetical protein [Tiger frog virus]QKG82493.1 hypothetical protein [Tiger frog virus]